MSQLLFKYLLVSVLSLLFSAVCISQTRWRTEQASVRFEIKNAGITVDGNFSGFEGNILFEANSLKDSRLEGSIAANSIETGIKLRDKDLKKEKYFYVEAYPRITLISQSIERMGDSDSTFSGTFLVNMKGVEKEITFPFIFKRQNQNGRFKGNFTLNRRDFNVGSGSLLLADEVDIFIDITVSAYQ